MELATPEQKRDVGVKDKMKVRFSYEVGWNSGQIAPMLMLA